MHYLANNKSSRHWINRALIHSIAITALALVTGCGGGGGGGGTTAPEPAPTPTPTPTTLQGNLVISVNGVTRAVGNVSYSSTASANAAAVVTAQASNVTGLNGSFTYSSGGTVTFALAGQTFTVTGASTVTAEMLAASQASSSCETACQNTVANNIELFLLNADDDNNVNNDINLNPSITPPAVSLNSEVFAAKINEQRTKAGLMPLATFTPSLGMNTEAAQAEQDSVAQVIPFADIFRVARPFRDLSSCTVGTINYDANGWPSPSVGGNCTIRTALANNANANNIPNGVYTVLYDGNGTLEFGNNVTPVPNSKTQGKEKITINFNGTQVNMNLKNIDPNDPIRNIRIVMPGGICEGNPFVRVVDSTGCPAGKYQAFADTLVNRNAIVFNPDYLNFMKDFRVIRMMNFMEASPSEEACDGESDYNSCFLEEFNWSQRSKMTDPSWGASTRTKLRYRYGRGVPLEVQVELANQLNAHPWFNIPHNATDDYVTQFATYVHDHLKTGLKAHVEYTNEAWNPIFWGALYARNKGASLGLDDNLYWAGAYYYAQRATEIFKIWESVFTDNTRLMRIIGTDQTTIDWTRNILNHRHSVTQDAVKDHVDVVAMNSYFYGCNDRQNRCDGGSSLIPWTFEEIATEYSSSQDTNRSVIALNKIFSVIDNANDPYGLPELQKLIVKQANEVKKFNKALYAYEGGQHLTSSSNSTLRELFIAANRDPRMGERYTTLLNAWKAAGGQQFMLYTQPQSFHQWGSFGIKESLLQPRSSAPKYDAAMKFQETQGKCWWNGC